MAGSKDVHYPLPLIIEQEPLIATEHKENNDRPPCKHGWAGAGAADVKTLLGPWLRKLRPSSYSYY